jgi:hypothetical protein
VLGRLLNTCADEEALTDSLWAVSYLSDGDEERISAVLEAGVVIKLVNSLLQPSNKLKLPALRAIGNIVTSTDAHTQAVVNAGALSILGNLVALSGRKQERKEACWAISNIAAGTAEQLSMVIQTGVLLPVTQALLHGEFEVKKEACWVICNAVHGSSNEQALFIAEQYKVVEPMVAMLAVEDARMVGITLDCFENLLKAGAAHAAKGGGENKVLVWLDEAGGVDKLEDLQEHKNEEVYKKAVNILETYVGEETDEDEVSAPATLAGGQQFAFGMQPHTSMAPNPMFASFA